MSLKKLLNLSEVARYFKRSPMRFTRAFDRVSGSCINDLYHLIHVILPEALRDYEKEVKSKKEKK